MATSTSVKLLFCGKLSKNTWMKTRSSIYPYQQLLQARIFQRPPSTTFTRCLCTDTPENDKKPKLTSKEETQKKESGKLKSPSTGLIPKKLNLAKPLSKKEKDQDLQQDDSSSSSDSDSDSDSSSSDEEGVSDKMVKAAKDVAKALPGDHKTTADELLERLQKHSAKKKASQANLMTLLEGMKIQDVTPKVGKLDQERPNNEIQRKGMRRAETTAADEGMRRGSEDRKPMGRDRVAQKNRKEERQPRRNQPYNRGKENAESWIARNTRWGDQMGLAPEIYNGNNLGIFAPQKSKKSQAAKQQDKQEEVTIVKDETKPTMFDIMDRERLEAKFALPPTNAFQEEIEWTKQGKMWTFPIDNEYDIGEEADIGFHEHVFLNHLITDFPKGPIRHFMELVAAGLSKNPYMSVKEKHAHIEWYREYFKDKQRLVDELLEEKTPAIEAN